MEWVEHPGRLFCQRITLNRCSICDKHYLPDLDEDTLSVDCGIRPKPVGPEIKVEDFYIKKEDGFEGFANLLGIESSGLTASLAICAKVKKILYSTSE